MLSARPIREHPGGGALRRADRRRRREMAGKARSAKDRFADAKARVEKLETRPSNDQLLDLYGLYKQSTEGDVVGTRPGMLDLKGRAKYDAWSKRKGTSRDDAMKAYVALVDELEKTKG
jgi:acyl-CoA-binding protein